jgi:hypothetical protein
MHSFILAWNPLLNFRKIKLQIFAIYVLANYGTGTLGEYVRRNRKLRGHFTLKPMCNAAKMFEETGNFAATPYLEADEQCGKNVRRNR